MVQSYTDLYEEHELYKPLLIILLYLTESSGKKPTDWVNQSNL